MGINMHKHIADNNASENIIYRPNHNIPFGVPDEQFNVLFNSLDCHFLPTMAEGFGLTIIEGMAAGVPTMATRTTAVTELLEDDRGISIIPRGYHIFDDAANTRKHIIDFERSIIALGELYKDWRARDEGERWGGKTKLMVDKGLEFCNNHTWDIAAKEFDKIFKEAINERIEVVDAFTPESTQRVLFIRTGTAGDIMQTLPAVRSFAAKHENAEVVYAMPSNLCELFNCRLPFIHKLIPVEKLRDKKKPSSRSEMITLFQMSGPEINYERGCYPYIERSRQQIYAMHTRLTPDEISTKDIFHLKAQELERGKAVFDKQVKDPSSFVVGFADWAEHRTSQWGNDDSNWKSLEKYCKSMKMEVFRLDKNEKLPINLAALSNCNLVVSLDSSIFEFLKSMDLPTIVLLSPIWQSKARGWDNCTIVARYELFGQMQEKMADPNEPNPYIEAIGVGEVFSPILTTYKAWKNEQKEAQEAQESEVTVETN
jgi:hypothetical protein